MTGGYGYPHGPENRGIAAWELPPPALYAGGAYCSSCGYPLARLDGFCVRCGASAGAFAGVAAPSGQWPAPPGAAWSPAPLAPAGQRPRWNGLSSALIAGWLATGVVAVIAPFLKFNGYISMDDGSVSAAANSDGWGAYRRVSGDIGTGRDTMFGIVLLIAAVLLVVAAAGLLSRPRAGWPLVSGLTGSVVTITCAALVALDTMSRASFQDSDGNSSYQTDTGAGFWLTMVCGLLAVAAMIVGLVLLARRGSTARSAGPTPFAG